MSVGVVGARRGAEVLEGAHGLRDVDLQHPGERQGLTRDLLQLGRDRHGGTGDRARPPDQPGPLLDQLAGLVDQRTGGTGGAREQARERAERIDRRIGLDRQSAQLGRRFGDRVEGPAAFGQSGTQLAHALADLGPASGGGVQQTRHSVGCAAQVLRPGGKAGDHALAVAHDRPEGFAVLVDLLEQRGGVVQRRGAVAQGPIDVRSATAGCRVDPVEQVREVSAHLRGEGVHDLVEVHGLVGLAAAELRALGQLRRGLVALDQLHRAIHRAHVRREADVRAGPLVDREALVDGHRYQGPVPGADLHLGDGPHGDGAGSHVTALDQPADVVERRPQLVGPAPRARQREGREDDHDGERTQGEHAPHPSHLVAAEAPPGHAIGNLGLNPQKRKVMVMLRTVTRMRLTAMERAVAVPTSTGPPPTL